MLNLDQKIQKLKSMKVSKLRKNMLKLVDWDRGVKIYNLSGLNSMIDKYSDPSYTSHPFIKNLESFTLID